MKLHDETLADAPAAPRRWYGHLYLQVLVAIAAGVLIGHFAPATGGAEAAGRCLHQAGEDGDRAGDLPDDRDRHCRDARPASVGRVAAKAFAYFLFFSTLALIVGLIVGNIVRPGAGLNIDPASLDAGKVATTPPRRTRRA
jgi:aerobic C4-dicarboxylate transport protein